MISARRIILEGRVQGLGVRPAIARLATRLELSGWVRNRSDGVEVELQGEPCSVEAFERELASHLPPGTVVDRFTSEEIAVGDSGPFRIEAGASEGPLRTAVPPDAALCDHCRGEVSDPNNRRCEYPLTTCAACGPRFSVITAMPFERNATTMHSFAMCAMCAAEYRNPVDRRFHAQTIACPNCGPRVWCVDGHGRVLGAQREAVFIVVEALKGGQIVALRGIGGYQLLCDATSSEAVRRFRNRWRCWSNRSKSHGNWRRCRRWRPRHSRRVRIRLCSFGGGWALLPVRLGALWGRARVPILPKTLLLRFIPDCAMSV